MGITFPNRLLANRLAMIIALGGNTRKHGSSTVDLIVANVVNNRRCEWKIVASVGRL